MLAVDVFRSGAHLFVRSTTSNASEQVAIAQVDEGVYAVVGLNGTDIRNEDDTLPDTGAEYKVITGINGNINVDLKGGDDILAVGNDFELLLDKFENVLEGFAGAIGNADEIATEVTEDFTLTDGFEVPRNLNILMGDGIDGVAIVADVGTEGPGEINADLGNGTFNGISIDPTTVSDDILLRAGRGDDQVDIFETTIAQMLIVNLGDGFNVMDVEETDIGHGANVLAGKHDDIVNFYNTHVELSLIIGTNAGNDEVLFAGGVDGDIEAGIDQNLNINTGSGHDDVHVGGEDVALIHINGSALINTLSGNDEVDVLLADIGGDLVVNTLDGIDRVWIGAEFTNTEEGPPVSEGEANVVVGDDLLINVGTGDDHSDNDAGVAISQVFVNDTLNVTLGSGNDSLDIELSAVVNSAFLNGDSGNDEFAFLSSAVGNSAFLNAGTGHDNAFIRDVDVGNLFQALMGSGDDELNIGGTSSADRTILDGGPGDDTLLDDATNDPGDLTVRNFENP
jgi:hypothetical protein